MHLRKGKDALEEIVTVTPLPPPLLVNCDSNQPLSLATQLVSVQTTKVGAGQLAPEVGHPPIWRYLIEYAPTDKTYRYLLPI